jgi:small subunit ribosomal protein S16
MSVKLRFVRIGKKNQPAYRLCAIESRKARDGQYIENLGFYDPHIPDDKKKVRIVKERAEYWLSVGAQPSQTVLNFFKKEKIAGLIRKPKAKRRKRPKVQEAGAKLAANLAGTRLAGTGLTGSAPGAKPSRKPKPPKKPKPAKDAPAVGPSAVDPST